MNEQECLQRVIDILADNAHGMCAVEGDSNDIILDVNMDGVQTVAKEITAIFKQPQKDTRSGRERALDAEFERMNIKPHICHFTKRAILRGAFNAITIATIEPKHKSISTCIEKNTRLKIIEQVTHLIKRFDKNDIYGIAICDRRDVFSKRYGRMKAKGRLLQHLLKEQQK